MKLTRSLGAVAASAALVFGSSTGMAHAGGKADPRIIGGQQASNPAYVQLVFGQSDGTYGCSGEAISSEWILTAQHCIDGDQWMDVYYSNSTSDRGEPVKADNFYASPNGDVALVHLSAPHELDSYPKLTDQSSDPSSGEGTIYGYGARANGEDSDGLYQATVNIEGSSTDAYDGPAIHVTGEDGASNHGDSGGPLVVDDAIVGVCSTGDTADPGDDTHAGSNYASIAESRSWIQQTAGV